MGIFKLNKKKENVIDSYNSGEVDGAEVWMVSWDARFGVYSHNTKRVAKAFLNYDDASKFAESLKEAKALLQYTEPINIKVEKQV